MSVSLNGTNGLTFADSTTQNTGGYTGFRNRIINGAMMIDQRNAGASVTGGGFSVDRWYSGLSTSAWSAQRSATAPSGFSNSAVITVVAPQAPGTTNVAYLVQNIEGYNTADFAFGSSAATSVTLSFWVRSSVTGTFTVALLNSAQNRSCVATYTINAANTWEYKSITVAGDTSGVWLIDNGKGLSVYWDLGSGSNFQTTAGAWQAGTFLRTSGSSNFANTSGATFYITGVQLEKGSVATPFEFRPYGTELQLCQRYYYSSTGQSYWFFPPSTGDPNGKCNVMFKQTMRTSPACTATKSGGGSSTITFDTITIDGVAIAIQSWGNNAAQLQSLTASAEL